MKRGKHPWWSGSPVKKQESIKKELPRGKTTVNGNAVYVASTYRA